MQIGSQRFIRGVKVRSLSHLIFTRVNSVISIWKVLGFGGLFEALAEQLLDTSDTSPKPEKPQSDVRTHTPSRSPTSINPGPLPSRRHEALCNGRPVCKEKPEDTQTQLHPRCFMKGGAALEVLCKL